MIRWLEASFTIKIIAKKLFFVVQKKPQELRLKKKKSFLTVHESGHPKAMFQSEIVLRRGMGNWIHEYPSIRLHYKERLILFLRN